MHYIASYRVTTNKTCNNTKTGMQNNCQTCLIGLVFIICLIDRCLLEVVQSDCCITTKVKAKSKVTAGCRSHSTGHMA